MNTYPTLSIHSLKRYGIIFLISAFMYSFSMPLKAFQTGLKEHAIINLDKQQFSLKAGDTALIRISIDIEKGWHAYDLQQNIRNKKSGSGIGPSPTLIKFSSKNIAAIGRIIAPKSDISYDSTFEVQIGTWHGKVSMIVPLIVKNTLKKGIYKDSLLVESQVCTDEGICTYPSKKYPISFTITQESINASSDTSVQDVDLSSIYSDNASDSAITNVQKNTTTSIKKDTKKSVVTESQAEYNQAKDDGVFSFLWAAILAGFAALTTPCVYPMIPITVSFFTKRAEKASAKSVADSLVFATGIIVTFTILGLLFALLSNAAGIRNFANNPWMNIFLASIFILFAFNLFGAFEIMLPTSLLNKLNSASSKGNSFGSVLLMGITFSITSFTCTLGFVAAAFGEAASAVKGGEGDLFYPMLGMLGFSGAFALPFFLLALFPSQLSKMPKAGTWMNILGLYKLKLDSPIQNISAPRLVFALIFASMTFYLLQGMNGRSVGEFESFIYSDSATPIAAASMGGSADTKAEEWTEDFQAALKLAKEKNQPVFLDFTGVTCTNCRKMEKNVFPRPAIAALMDKMIKVRMYTDRDKPEDKANEKMMQDEYKSAELPLYVMLTPQGQLIDQTGYTPDTEKFQKFLKKALNE